MVNIYAHVTIYSKLCQYSKKGIKNMSVREDIKVLLSRENWTMTELVDEINKRTGKDGSRSNFSHKLANKTLRYEEAKLIGDILGYDLTFVKRQ